MNNVSYAYRPAIGVTRLTSSSNKDLVEEYLVWKQSYAKPAVRSYRIWVERFQAFVNKPPEALTHTDYTAFARSLEGKHASKGIQYALTVVHNYLRFYFEQGRLRFPLYLARVPKARSNSHLAITEEEYQTLVESLKAQAHAPLRDLAIIMLLHDTGVRVGELLSLEIEDIEEDRSAVVKTEKTIRERRIFWNPATDLIVQQYLVERINDGTAKCDALFVGDGQYADRPLSRRAVQSMLKRNLHRARIEKKICPHSFRHAFIHRLARLGVPDAIIAQLVGHSTPMTIAHYTKLSRPEFREYAEMQLGRAA
ncbi:MAG: site-specific integrase [Verrucomicrobiota bacterium]